MKGGKPGTHTFFLASTREESTCPSYRRTLGSMKPDAGLLLSTGPRHLSSCFAILIIWILLMVEDGFCCSSSHNKCQGSRMKKGLFISYVLLCNKWDIIGSSLAVQLWHRVLQMASKASAGVAVISKLSAGRFASEPTHAVVGRA